MEAPSAPLRTGCIPWQRLLVIASLLTFWNSPTTAQITIEPVPPNAIEGENVLLHVHNVPWNIQSYIWYKGGQALDNHQIAVYVIDPDILVPGPDYTGRETVYPNGSLLLQKVSQEDTGFYILQTLTRDLRAQEASVQLRVDAQSKVGTAGNWVQMPWGKELFPTQHIFAAAAQAENSWNKLMVPPLPTSHQGMEPEVCSGGIRAATAIRRRWYLHRIHQRLKMSQKWAFTTSATLLLSKGGHTRAETMEPFSAPPSPGCVPWQGLLFTASLLTFWNSPSTAQLTIEAVPPHVAEGKSVLLLVHNLPENPQTFYWYKGKFSLNDREIARYIITRNSSKPGPAHSGRTSFNDSQIAKYITTTSLREERGPAHSGRETIYSNGSLLFDNVTHEDTGSYTLLTLDTDGHFEETSVQFNVYRPVTEATVQTTKTSVIEIDSVVFTCHSGGSVISTQWIFNNQRLQLPERMTLSQNNRRLSINPVKMDDAGDYQCEVTNPVSYKKSRPVHLEVSFDPEQESCGLLIGSTAGIMVGAVAGVVLIAALACFLYLQNSRKGSYYCSVTEPTPSAYNHSLGFNDNCPNEVDEVAFSVLDFNTQQPSEPTPSEPTPSEPTPSEPTPSKPTSPASPLSPATEEVHSEAEKD
ncbi:LOW QUALITY PROTEIN: pregnancy-specific glycoprotein 22-like [Nannospalax galili]|uniref:LOW QUALITY PROTEIN: pregnancy-specific glycoprotein 22-like n=1 Tax=Nannospalax galili TaxID=1026970 RepID=UPI00111C3C90|nr:LOW QUALITY PROTEIN: pregnancy-specific glycoprotein 22-like [Nannospalax galili]